MMTSRTITQFAATLLATATLLAAAVPAAAECTQDGCYDDPEGGGASALDTELVGATFYGPGDEAVEVAARIHLVAQPPKADGSVVIHVNVASATASGLESGQRYAFTGADSVLIPGNPVVPDDPIRVSLSFRMKPDGPPIRVAVTAELRFDAGGRLASAVMSFDGHTSG